MVGQHDAAGADADGLRAARDMGHNNGGRGAGDARHVVVFGEPIAPVAQPLGMAGKVERIGERLRGIAALRDRRQVENRKGRH